MGQELLESGDLEKAERLHRDALAKRTRVLGVEHPDTLTSMANLGIIFLAQGKAAESQKMLGSTLEKRRRTLGDRHVDTIKSMTALGVAYWDDGKLELVAPLVEEALLKSRQFLGAEDPETIISINNLGALRRDQGRLSEAEPLLRQSLALRRRISGEEHPQTLVTANMLAVTLADQGRLAEAEPLLRENLAMRVRVLGAESRDASVSKANLCSNLRDQGKLTEAEPLCREVVEHFRKEGEDSFYAIEMTSRYAKLLQLQGNNAQAIALLAPKLNVARTEFAGDLAPRLGKFINTLGMARSALNDFSAAEKHLLEAQTIFQKTPGSDAGYAHENLLALVAHYRAWQQSDPSKNYAQQGEIWQQRLSDFEAKHPDRW
jgi:tetratricopeptide (TPR) repeat protein